MSYQINTTMLERDGIDYIQLLVNYHKKNSGVGDIYLWLEKYFSTLVALTIFYKISVNFINKVGISRGMLPGSFLKSDCVAALSCPSNALPLPRIFWENLDSYVFSGHPPPEGIHNTGMEVL